MKKINDQNIKEFNWLDEIHKSESIIRGISNELQSLANSYGNLGNFYMRDVLAEKADMLYYETKNISTAIAIMLSDTVKKGEELNGMILKAALETCINK